MTRIFLLSPASTGGRRAGHLFAPRAAFDLALRVRSPEGEAIGEVFSFLSGLYFRGKLAYARAFAEPDTAVRVTLADLEAMARSAIDLANPAYRAPLERDAEQLVRALGRHAEVVLLGSIATGKYAEVLLEAFGPRLLFPEEFVGRGDMSRGGLMLRAAREGRELAYVQLAGAVRRGKRPARLVPTS